MTMRDKAIKIVDSVSSRMGLNGITIINNWDTAENLVGTDGYTFIMVGPSKELGMYPRTTATLYKVAYIKMQDGALNPDDEYEEILLKNLKLHTKPPEVEILLEDNVDDLNIVVWTDELMRYTLPEMADYTRKENKNETK